MAFLRTFFRMLSGKILLLTLLPVGLFLLLVFSYILPALNHGLLGANEAGVRCVVEPPGGGHL